MPEPGTIIDGRYRVVSRIGSGGMADVYLAEDLQLGRQVALKILHRRFAEDQEFVERFRREASSAAGLSHPNVVNVFDRGETEGTYYIAMEYLPGESLKALVRRGGAVDPATAIDYVIQILRAARFAHSRGVIHRDLKPHNVIVDEEGRVRVTDFGIARAGASDMTQTGSIMGTAQYLSPEQAQGHAVSAASDIYAIGIVLYELLTGTLPFDGETAVTIALKQVSELPMPPSAVNPAVPPALDAVVLRALAKDPQQRFADAGAFIAALEQARASLQPDIGDTARFAALELAGAAAAGAVSSPPASLPAALALPPLDEPEPEPDADEERRRRWWWLALGIVLLALAGVGAALLLHTSQVTVPTLARCESQLAARAQLRESGLTATVRSVTTTACAPGEVVGQVPSGGSVRDKNSSVAVLVSAGPGVAAVPAVTGQARAAATQALSAAGFRSAVQQAASSNVATGHVIATNPRAGTELTRGSTVSVQVSSGPQTVSVPDVRGELQTAAALALVNAGLKTGSVTEQNSNEPPGTVLSQNPAGGSLIPMNTAVDLTVAKQPQQLVLINVVGSGEVQAGAELGAAGYNVTSVTQPVTDPAKNNRVISQSPSAGTNVKRGSTVTITVGAYSSSTTTTASSTTGATTGTTSTTSSAPAGAGASAPGTPQVAAAPPPGSVVP